MFCLLIQSRCFLIQDVREVILDDGSTDSGLTLADNWGRLEAGPRTFKL